MLSALAITTTPLGETVSRGPSSSSSKPMRKPSGDRDALVDDRPADLRPPADVHPRKDDRILDLGVAVDAGLRADDRPRHAAAGDDRPGAHDAVVRRAAAVLRVEHELRRRQIRLIRPHRPVVVVQIELRLDARQLDVRLEVASRSCRRRASTRPACGSRRETETRTRARCESSTG